MPGTQKSTIRIFDNLPPGYQIPHGRPRAFILAVELVIRPFPMLCAVCDKMSYAQRSLPSGEYWRDRGCDADRDFSGRENSGLRIEDGYGGLRHIADITHLISDAARAKDKQAPANVARPSPRSAPNRRRYSAVRGLRLCASHETCARCWGRFRAIPKDCP
jgi:hypothetical protein